jgi:hypothetical protein
MYCQNCQQTTLNDFPTQWEEVSIFVLSKPYKGYILPLNNIGRSVEITGLVDFVHRPESYITRKHSFL